jgi:hypothetical protein
VVAVNDWNPLAAVEVMIPVGLGVGMAYRRIVVLRDSTLPIVVHIPVVTRYYRIKALWACRSLVRWFVCIPVCCCRFTVTNIHSPCTMFVCSTRKGLLALYVVLTERQRHRNTLDPRSPASAYLLTVKNKYTYLLMIPETLVG